MIVDGSEVLLRLNADGSRDTNFLIQLSQFGFVNAIHVLPDDRIIIAGRFYSVAGHPRDCLALVNSDGSISSDLDTSYAPFGRELVCLLPQSDSKLVVGGDSFARVSRDGAIDPDFEYWATTGLIRYYSFAAQVDGRIVAGGDFSRVQEFYRENIIRFQTNGMMDVSFDPGLGADNWVITLAVQPDQRILIGGFFTSYDGVPQAYLARVLNDWPVLDQRRIGTDRVELSWPAVYTNFVLQSAASVPSTNWITVTNTPVLVSNICYVTNTVAGGNQFFRLVKQP